MNIIIRDLCIEDIEDMHKLIRKSIDITFAMLSEQLIKRISCGELTVVALVDDKFVGLICATVDHKLIGGNVAFVEDLYVISEFRNMGIGTLLGKYILNRIWDLGCNKALSYTGLENISSNRVHEKVGALLQKDCCWKYIKQGVK